MNWSNRNLNPMEEVMTINNSSEAAKAVVRRNTEEVQGGGNFDVFDELFADDFLDHTPQPGRTPDKAGARELYRVLRAAFPDFHADIHWQIADGDRVTTYKTYHGTHRGEFLGVPPTGRKIQFETVDVMRVRTARSLSIGAWPISSPCCSSSAPGPPSRIDCRADRLRRHRSWIARGRRQGRSVSRRVTPDPGGNGSIGLVCAFRS